MNDNHAPTARAALLVLTLAVLATAPAAAHSEPVPQGREVPAGPYVAHLNPDPEVLYANTTNQAFTLQVTRPGQEGYAQVDAALHLRSADGAFDETLEFRRINSQYMIATTTLHEPGAYAARLVLRDDAGEHEGTTSFDVYPDHPFRLRPLDPTLDVIAGVRAKLVYETVDPITLERIDAFDDLTVRIERWSEEHAARLGTEEVQAQREGVGLWRVEHVFGEGHHYLAFASDDGGFNYNDLPLLHTDVYANQAVDEPDETPAPAALAAVAALGAGAALLGRRHRR